ncbi:disease resistance protein RGA2 [Hordeum vulgare]|nr:disease resistance protein RGA2 [Hordeum vulgare]
MQSSSDNLNSLQHALSKNVRNKRFLIVLDDMWDDALEENGLRWKRFCAPLRNVMQGSMILVTTRSPKVADGVGTMEPFVLDGLKDDVFWNFFKVCVFGSESSNSEPELELIGRSILPKLKGSPLAAKTLGRLLKRNLHVTHWNKVLESELWELRQNKTEILPALRLSYMYLPFHLKRCFSFCAVYPKDHRFEKGYLAEIWAAEGFVKPQGDIPIQDIGCQYFEDLVERSFFQKVRDTYVIHDLLHDMAQLVSEHDCFVIKNMSDFQKVPQDVRHLSILSSTKFDRSTLLSLCKHTKLRTLFCNKSLRNKTVASVVDHWFNELRLLRIIFFSVIEELPDSVGNLKHLRYLKISRTCPFDSLPSAICCLYNLQIFSARECKLESLPSDFSKLISLQSFESNGFRYDQDRPLKFDANSEQGLGMRLIKNVNQFCGDLEIYNLSTQSKDHAAQAELKNKRYLNSLTLEWSFSRSQGNSEIEVLQVLQPSINLKSLLLRCYPGVSLPNWFQPQNLANLASLSLHNCDGLESILFSRISQGRNLNDSIGTFLALTVISIYGCKNLSSLEQVLHPASVPAIKKITIQYCKKLVSVPIERFGDLHYLDELCVSDCPNIYSHSLVVPSLKRLVLGSSGNLAGNIECSSLACLSLSCHCLTSIQPQMWRLPALLELHITECRSLTTIGQPEHFFTNISRGGGTTSVICSSLTSITIYDCQKLSTIEDLLTEEYLPAIERILVGRCGKLISLSSEMFGSFPFLKDLKIHDCPSINWQRGLVFPSSLQRLYLRSCGDISAWVPSSLQNLASLVSLQMIECPRVVSIPGEVWSSDLTSLEELKIQDCPDLVSIGGAKAIAEIRPCLES